MKEGAYFRRDGSVPVAVINDSILPARAPHWVPGLIRRTERFGSRSGFANFGPERDFFGSRSYLSDLT